MNRFTVCLVLPFVIWGASKVDTDLAFACFCSSFFYVAWCVVRTIMESHEQTARDIHERNKDLFFHKYPGAPPKGQD